MTPPHTAFVDNGLRAVRRYRPGEPVAARVETWRGSCLEVRSGRAVEHTFADGPDPVSWPVRLSGAAAGTAREVLGAPVAPPDAPDRQLGDLCARGRAELTWACHRQRVAVGNPDKLVVDERGLVTVEVAAADAPGASQAVVADLSDVDGTLRRVAEAVDEVRALAALPPGRLPAGGCSVVLEPGRAGAFFHELLGHPLEADVVASGSSYLAGLIGERVAPAWLYVTDGPAPPGMGTGAGVDDEGTPVRTVDLVGAGRVSGVLSDAATAALLGTASTGHGRRLDYRHPAIPRMWHTTARAVGVAVQAPDRCRLAPRGLRLRRMNLLTGAFEFVADTAVLDTGEGAPRRLGACAIRGSAPAVLAALRPGSPEVVGYARATKGCGKLGQFPLVTTFANSGMWIPAEVIDVRDDVDP